MPAREFDTAAAIEACLQNAELLIEEANLLRSHEHIARAAALALVAIEETAKVVWLLFAELEGLEERDAKDWAGFRNHRFKLNMHNLIVQFMRIFLPPEQQIGPGFELADANDLVAEREAALYVNIVDNRIYEPEGVLTSDRSDLLISQAQDFFEFHARLRPFYGVLVEFLQHYPRDMFHEMGTSLLEKLEAVVEGDDPDHS